MFFDVYIIIYLVFIGQQSPYSPKIPLFFLSRPVIPDDLCLLPSGYLQFGSGISPPLLLPLPPRHCGSGKQIRLPVFLSRSGINRLNLDSPDGASVLVVFPSWWLLSGSLIFEIIIIFLIAIEIIFLLYLPKSKYEIRCCWSKCLESDVESE